MTGREIAAAVRAYCERNDVSLGTFSEAVGQRFDLKRDSAARRINEVERTGTMSDEWIDRFAVMLDLQGEQESHFQPGLDAYCPKCRQVQPSRGDGTCLWCDAQTGGNTIANYVDPLDGRRKERRSSNAGIPWKCSEEDIQEVRRLYLTGLSMRAACEEVHPRTDYSNPTAMAMAMYSLFEQRGWNRRSQREATAARNYKHGKARDRSHIKKLRRKTGIVRGVRCKGLKRHAPGVGKQCQMFALKDSEFCRAHDPRYAELHVQHCREMRQKLEAAA